MCTPCTNASEAAVARATEIRELAVRQMGEFLKQMPDAPRGVKKQLGSDVEPNATPTLAEIGITKNQRRVRKSWQPIPAEEFHERIPAALATLTAVARSAGLTARNPR